MARDLAIDLGTANTLVYAKGEGIVLNEPSVIALNTADQRRAGHGPRGVAHDRPDAGHIVAVRPLRKGAITDFEITQRMIRLLLQRAGVNRFNRPRVVICVPSAITAGRAPGRHRRGPGAGAAEAQPARAADGRRHRRRAADQRAGRQHGGRHRGRDVGDGAHLARRGGRPRGRAGRQLRHRRGDPAPTSGAPTASPSGSARRRRSRSPSARRIRPQDDLLAEVRGRELCQRAAQDRDPLGRGGPRRHPRAGQRHGRLRRALPGRRPRRSWPRT